MDLKIEAKFLGQSVEDKITQQTQTVIQQEVSSVTPQFLVHEYTFTAESNPNDSITLPVTLTPNMEIISMVLMFDVDYPLTPVASSGENIGNWSIGKAGNDQFFGSMAEGMAYQSFRPLLYTPVSSEQVKIHCDHYQQTTGLTGRKIKTVVEYIDISAP